MSTNGMSWVLQGGEDTRNDLEEPERCDHGDVIAEHRIRIKP